ncbi:MAG: TetR/AcrR family transcriptional regulator [Rhodospirillales bacterium]|jgi:TetR/AcrR family transcriptional regulator|nr:TetR/AcrR family transcriptional regulator [Rhodospirillales bacterium]
MNWERARTPDQQEQRRQEILEAAATLFRELTYEDVSLNAIAREAGFTKSNIYRYFASREEIFLALFLVDFSEWANEFIEILNTLPAGTPAADLAEVWVEILMKHERMLDLTPLLGVALERNVSESTLFHFKFSSHQMMSHIVEGLLMPLPMMNADQGRALLMRVHGLVAGLWPFSKPNEIMEAVLQRPELDSSHFSFEDTLLGTIEILVRDIQKSTPQ